MIRLPFPSWLPLISALFIAVFFVAFLASEYTVAGAGVVLAVVALTVWAWRNGEPKSSQRVDAGHGEALPLHYDSPSAPGVWGTGMGILIDAALYASLLYAYYFLWTVSGDPPPPGHGDGTLWLPVLGLGLLVLGSAGMVAAKSAATRGARIGMRLGLVLAAVTAVAFGFAQIAGLSAAGFAPGEHAYPALIVTIVVFHLVHVFVALLMLGISLVRSFKGMGGEHILSLRIAAMFWHYIVIAWAIGFATIYLFPLLA